MNENKKILVFGATGFLGKNLNKDGFLLELKTATMKKGMGHLLER